jgi:superfamily II DNA/RNA helicase
MLQINCDILISVPSILEESLKLETVRLKRLCHVAIEDAHVLLKTHNQSMEKLFTVMNKLQINRPHNKNIQIVVSSEKWSPDLDTLLKKLYTRPLVYIEDFLEAALYSNIKFKTKKVKSSHKLFYLEDILKTNYRSHRTIVFCKDKEILDISEYLKICGVECITISNDLMEDEIHENENLWCSLNTETYKGK